MLYSVTWYIAVSCLQSRHASPLPHIRLSDVAIYFPKSLKNPWPGAIQYKRLVHNFHNIYTQFVALSTPQLQPLYTSTCSQTKRQVSQTDRNCGCTARPLVRCQTDQIHYILSAFPLSGEFPVITSEVNLCQCGRQLTAALLQINLVQQLE